MHYEINKSVRLGALGILVFSQVSLVQTVSSDEGFIVFGGAQSPSYQGSDDYDTVPMIVSDFSLLGVPVELEGLTLRAGLLEGNNWTYGVTTELDFGRDSEVNELAVANMTAIESTTYLGLFAAHERNNVMLVGDTFALRLSALTDASSHSGGAYSTLETSYTLPLMLPWRIGFELATTYASSNYMNTYFGVSERDASLSGLPEYSASSSIRDVTLSTNIGLFFSPKWGLFARLSASKLMGEAQDSPIVELGDSNQYFVGLGAIYRFGG